MRTELENKLAQEFPFMRRDPAALKQDFVEDLYSAFGCECDDGWYELLREMCAEIVSAHTKHGVKVDFKPLQIKEKYGALRVYFSTSNEAPGIVSEIIDRCEEKSMTICEACGQPGILRSDLSWHQTLCDTHYQDAANVKKGDIKSMLENLKEMAGYIDSGYTPVKAVNKVKENAEEEELK